MKKRRRKRFEEIGLPIVIRPSFTPRRPRWRLCRNQVGLLRGRAQDLPKAPSARCLSKSAWWDGRSSNCEVIRDLKDNVIIVCSIENVDPMGVHTGDSITVAPAQTLTDRQYQVLRDASIRIIREIGVETGGSNIQFAINPENGRIVGDRNESARFAQFGARPAPRVFPSPRSPRSLRWVIRSTKFSTISPNRHRPASNRLSTTAW